MDCLLEYVVAGNEGKEGIRNRFSPHSNYPMVCRNPKCYFPLGILHTDPISESAYFEEGISKRGELSSVTYPNCQTKLI